MTNFVLTTLLLMAFDFEAEGMPGWQNLAGWLVRDMDNNRRWDMPSIFD